MATHGPHIRLTLREGVEFGPGKAQLLEGIRNTGSIAAAGRRMKMSYSRAWGLVETMNTEFRAPLVASAKGGASHGGAVLTALGHQVLACYRRMEASAARAVAEDLAELRRNASASRRGTAPLLTSRAEGMQKNKKR